VEELRDDAFLLRSVDYRDHDRIVTLLTRRHGTLGVIARGARRSRKRFGGALEPFQRVAVTWRPGRGLGTLTEAVVTRSHPALQRAGDATTFVRSLSVEGHPDPELFEAFELFLARSAELPVEDGDALALAFRVRALNLLGLSPDLECCGVSGLPCPADRPAYFDPERGTLVSRRFGGGPYLLGPRTRERLLEAAKDAWVEVRFADDERDEALPAVEAFVAAHVGRRER
jgi:DNA repair protein RecO (recombination protein O)